MTGCRITPAPASGLPGRPVPVTGLPGRPVPVTGLPGRRGDGQGDGAGLVVLAVDDETPALEDLTYLLARQEGVARVAAACDANEALRLLRADEFHVVLLDIRMPGLDGMDLARVLARFDRPPAVIFVSAFDQHAVEAFEVRAVDYLLKPVGEIRLRSALGRVRRPPTGEDHGRGVDEATATPTAATLASGAAGTTMDDGLAVVPVDHGDRVLLVDRDRVMFVEAAGDYVRLHTADAHYLVRLSLATLEERWGRHGFVRIHRQYLVAARHISELRIDGGANPTVMVHGRELPVSRRHAREVRDVLVRSRRRVASDR